MLLMHPSLCGGSGLARTSHLLPCLWLHIDADLNLDSAKMSPPWLFIMWGKEYLAPERRVEARTPGSSLTWVLLNLRNLHNCRPRSHHQPQFLASSRTNLNSAFAKNPTLKTRFYAVIKLFLWLSMVLLGFEVAAYFQCWHFGRTQIQLQHLLAGQLAVRGMFESLYSSWVLIRVEYLAPTLQFLTNMCVVLFLMQSLDRLVLCLGLFWIQFMNIKPVPRQIPSIQRERVLPHGPRSDPHVQ